MEVRPDQPTSVGSQHTEYVSVPRADLKLILDLAADQMAFRQNEWLAFHRLLDAATEPKK